MSLIDARDKQLPGVLQTLLNEPAMRRDALRGLGAVEDAKTPAAILKIYSQLDTAGRRDALTTLASRVSFAKALMKAVTAKQVKANELPADTVRQLRALGQKEINAQLDKVWGVSRSTPEAKLAEIAKYKKLLSTRISVPDNLSNGRALYQRTCAQCHKLYGEGGEIGPDITGSNRNTLDYLLQNIIDPNADIPNDYRTTIVRLKDKRVLVGVIRQSEGQSVTLATGHSAGAVAEKGRLKLWAQELFQLHGVGGKAPDAFGEFLSGAGILVELPTEGLFIEAHLFVRTGIGRFI